MTLSEFASALVRQGLEAIGKYYSDYRGYVVDNVDPEGLGRIQVRIPEITRDLTHSKWAWPKNQFSGNNYGSQCLPMKGDLVWVSFQQGNTRFPLWSHGHFTQGEKPEEFSSPLIYGFKTPQGQIIVFDDSGEYPVIRINDGTNEGIVKVIPLTEKLNNLESKVNSLLDHYGKHVHIDPISGYTGVLSPPLGSPDIVTPIPLDLTETEQSEIENDKVIH